MFGYRNFGFFFRISWNNQNFYFITWDILFRSKCPKLYHRILSWVILIKKYKNRSRCQRKLSKQTSKLIMSNWSNTGVTSVHYYHSGLAGYNFLCFKFYYVSLITFCLVILNGNAFNLKKWSKSYKSLRLVSVLKRRMSWISFTWCDYRE